MKTALDWDFYLFLVLAHFALKYKKAFLKVSETPWEPDRPWDVFSTSKVFSRVFCFKCRHAFFCFRSFFSKLLT